MAKSCVEQNVAEVTEAPLEVFARKIDEHGRFKIVGTDNDDKDLVLLDTNFKEGEMGHRLDISIEEINKALEDVLSVLLGGRNEIVCKGYSRIVGYFSGTHNWGKSKISELRDRAKGSYGNVGFVPQNQEERMDAIENLSVMNMS